MKENLSLLQSKIKEKNLDAYIVSKRDMFLNDEIADSDNKLLWVTGFTGSAGYAFIFADESKKNLLFVDGRYELQAQKQVDLDKFEILNIKETGLEKYLKESKLEIRIGFNAFNHSADEIIRGENLAKRTSLNFRAVDDLIEPYLTKTIKEVKVFDYDIKYNGKSREEKIDMLVDGIVRHNIDAYFISKTDSVSWLLNVRSDELKNSPIVNAYALIDKDAKVKLFCNHKIDFDLGKKVEVYKLEEIGRELSSYIGYVIGMDNYSTPYKIYDMCRSYDVTTRRVKDICSYPKAEKNSVELKNIRNAHIKDGVAVIKLLKWLDVKTKAKEKISELDIVEQLQKFRSEQDLYFSNSFDTIAAIDDNGAFVHYRPTKETEKEFIYPYNQSMLLDSGGQYFDGTTDVTRTIYIGDNPSIEFKKYYTLVLKAHIKLSTLRFPVGTTGGQIDAIARQVLWAYGLDYSHGTGHGVGQFLNVHEGPQSISPKSGKAELKEGMIISIEPGYYKEGKFGIRIENLVEIVKVKNDNFDQETLEFKPLTLIPYDENLIDESLINQEDIKYLKEYNDLIKEKIYPSLNLDECDFIETYFSK